MIRSRRYVVPLAAVLLALATGVALGAGPLTDTGSSASPGHEVVVRPVAPGYGDAFAGAVASRLYDHGLSRRPVAIVTLPGADPATVSALTAQVRAASGQVTGTLIDVSKYKADTSRDTLEAFAEADANTRYRLVLGDLNLEVIIGNVVVTPTPISGDDRVLSVQFDWWATGRI